MEVFYFRVPLGLLNKISYACLITTKFSYICSVR